MTLESAPIEERVLSLPIAIANPNDGLELIRVWRSPTDHYVSLFIGDKWRLKHCVPLVIDSALALSAHVTHGNGVHYKNFLNELFKQCFSKFDELSEYHQGGGTSMEGGFGITDKPGFQQEVSRQMLPIPVADPIYDDAFELYRGWADGERLQASVRRAQIKDINDSALAMAHVILHIGRAFTDRCDEDWQVNAAEFVRLLKLELKTRTRESLN